MNSTKGKSNVKLGGKTFNLIGEGAALAAGTGAQYAPGLAHDFLEGLAGGMAAASDPVAASALGTGMRGVPIERGDITAEMVL